jgi:hypothetical protein
MTEIKIEGVRINLPPDITASHIIGPSGEPYLVHVDADGTRWIDMSLKDCESMLPNADPSCASWRSANPAAFQRVGGEVKKPEVGVRIADRLHVARAAAARDPADLGGISRDTMQIIRGRTR